MSRRSRIKVLKNRVLNQNARRRLELDMDCGSDDEEMALPIHAEESNPLTAVEAFENCCLDDSAFDSFQQSSSVSPLSTKSTLSFRKNSTPYDLRAFIKSRNPRASTSYLNTSGYETDSGIFDASSFHRITPTKSTDKGISKRKSNSPLKFGQKLVKRRRTSSLGSDMNTSTPWNEVYTDDLKQLMTHFDEVDKFELKIE